MKKELLVTTAIALSISMSAATNTTSQMNTSSQNPFLKPYVTNYGIPPFEDIKAACTGSRHSPTEQSCCFNYSK